MNPFLLPPLVTNGFIFSFSITTSAQIYDANVVGRYPWISPLLLAAFKKPLNATPLLSEYIKPSKHEMVYWPNFPLNAVQIEARNREWNRKNRQTIGEQIAGDIIKNSVNSLIFGKKPVAVTPKF